MFRIALISFMLVFPATISLSHAQGASSSLNTDQIIKQLESSGALDRAVQKSIDRIKQKELEDQRASQLQKMQARAEMAKKARPVDPKNDLILGKPDAPITIIEYSDFECPYCKRFAPIPEQVVADMPNQVNLVWRNFPLDFHNPMATKEAAAALCAAEQGGNPAFWKFTNAIFKTTATNGKGIPAKDGEDPIVNLAESQGLDLYKFKECLSSDAIKKRITADIADGKNAGISGTPGVILVNRQTNKVEVLAGAVPIEAVKEAVNKLLAK
jgi:protein-disulfide isomerase